MSDHHLQTDIDDLRKKVTDIEGPIKDSIERIKLSLLGNADGSSKGLLSRVLILELQVSELLTTAAYLQKQADTAGQKINDIKTNCIEHVASIDNLKVNVDGQAQDRKWIRNLIWGTVAVGLVTLVMDWALHRMGFVK